MENNNEQIKAQANNNDEIQAQAFENFEKLEFLYDQNNKAIGVLYNGGHEPDYMNYVFPKFQLYIWRDDDIIDLTSAQIKLQIYTYDLNTHTKGNMIQEIDPSPNGNFFEYEIPNSPSQVYILLNVYETEWKTYEFETPVIGTKTAGEDRTYDLNMKLTVSLTEDQTFFEKLIQPIKDLIQLICDFVYTFFDRLTEFIDKTLDWLLIPKNDFLPKWSTEMEQKVNEKIPALALPLTTLHDFIWDHESYYVEHGAGFEWQPIEINGEIYFPGGGINFKDEIEKTPQLEEIFNLGRLFTNFTIAMAFVHYLRRKTSIVFGAE